MAPLDSSGKWRFACAARATKNQGPIEFNIVQPSKQRQQQHAGHQQSEDLIKLKRAERERYRSSARNKQTLISTIA